MKFETLYLPCHFCGTQTPRVYFVGSMRLGKCERCKKEQEELIAKGAIRSLPQPKAFAS